METQAEKQLKRSTKLRNRMAGSQEMTPPSPIPTHPPIPHPPPSAHWASAWQGRGCVAARPGSLRPRCCRRSGTPPHAMVLARESSEMPPAENKNKKKHLYLIIKYTVAKTPTYGAVQKKNSAMTQILLKRMFDDQEWRIHHL